MHYGYNSAAEADFAVGRTVELSNASWNINEMDIMPIPLRDLRAIPLALQADGIDQNFEIQIWARRTTDSDGDLYLDCLLPIPIDEGYLYLDEFSQTASVVYIYTSPTDVVAPIVIGSANVFADLPAPSPWQWVLPPGDGRMIIAWARASTSDFTDALAEINYISTDTGSYYERWLGPRGAE